MDNGLGYLAFLENKMQGSDFLYARASNSSQWSSSERGDSELDHKARRVSDKISESLNIVANEPSLAFFRIQEHVRKSLPQLVEQKHAVQEIHQSVQGACFDTEYAANAVRSMTGSTTHFHNIQDLLKNAMFMKQQIEYEEGRKKQEKLNPSMYTSSGGAAGGVAKESGGGQGAGLTVSTDSDLSLLTQSGQSQSSGECLTNVCSCSPVHAGTGGSCQALLNPSKHK